MTDTNTEPTPHAEKTERILTTNESGLERRNHRMRLKHAKCRAGESVRVLAIETSTARGSVALLEDGRDAGSAEHREPNAHAERMLSLVERVLDEAQWPRSSLERIAVGVGPGSFVGLRVGIALAEGLGLGLGRPVVGVPSLHAMLRAIPGERQAVRVALMDARRAEVFLTARSADDRELIATTAIARDAVAAQVRALGQDAVLVGEVAAELDLPWPVLRGEAFDLPHARWIARIAAELDPALSPPLPLYVRGAGATLPNLPPSPLARDSG